MAEDAITGEKYISRRDVYIYLLAVIAAGLVIGIIYFQVIHK